MPKPGDKVKVAQKKDYASGILTAGVVKDVLTSKKFHPRGHKVRLVGGVIGRVQEFLDEKATIESAEPKPEKTYDLPLDDDLV